MAACAETDWRAMGRQSGETGEKAKVAEKYADACRRQDEEMDHAAFEAGRLEGLASYCTEDGGFAAGSAGDSYEDVCPPNAEARFLAGYEIGETLYDLQKESRTSERAVR